MIDGRIDDYDYYNTLNTIGNYQDMVDKDNMTSIVFLLLNTKSKPKVSLIGREAFKLTYDGVKINYQSMQLPFISKDIKPDPELKKLS